MLRARAALPYPVPLEHMKVVSVSADFRLAGLVPCAEWYAVLILPFTCWACSTLAEWETSMKRLAVHGLKECLGPEAHQCTSLVLEASNDGGEHRTVQQQRWGNAWIKRPLIYSILLIVQMVSESAQRSFSVCVDRYGGEHRAPELQKEAVYGLTELHREEVKKARLVANPGCYPTTVQLPLCPLLEVTQAAGLPVSDMHTFPSCVHHGPCRGATAPFLILIAICLQQSLCKSDHVIMSILLACPMLTPLSTG